MWALPTPGGPDDFPQLVRQITSLDPSGSWPGAARTLWELRDKIGELLGWDDPDAVSKVSPLARPSLPGWICWLGLVQATLAVLSLASLVFFPAALLILLGRMLGFVWCVAVGIVLALGGRREPGTGADHMSGEGTNEYSYFACSQGDRSPAKSHATC